MLTSGASILTATTPWTKLRGTSAGAVEPTTAPKPAPPAPTDSSPRCPGSRSDCAPVPPPTLADRLRWASLLEAHLCPPPDAHAKPAPDPQPPESPEPYRAHHDTPTLGEVRPAPERPEVDRRIEIAERYERAFQAGLHLDLIA